MKHLFVFIIFITAVTTGGYAQRAIIREEKVTMNTYPFSDPDPVAGISRIYPYFRFDGYTAESTQKEWNMVVLENDYIKVFVCPDIGGKIWGALEKSTGKEFLYFNHVVKFRDVAMRGPWTSGGLEYNFGDIGHIPTCATPVDYTTRVNTDGSVSCIAGAIDLPSGTRWNVEIILHQDKAFFETRTSWFNCTSLPCTYYHWMNAAARASGNLEFIYPGNRWIGHGGEPGEWPVENGRNLSWYENNNFGTYKSYHVINAYSDYFGGYWHDDDFGFGHYCTYDDKPGKKLWIWGLSREGMIWEDLLTDSDGQYIEYQSGKLFNQAANSSTNTPFKHREFIPYDADMTRELWFPLRNAGGMVAASEYAVLNVTRNDSQVRLVMSALQAIDDQMNIRTGEKMISEQVSLHPLEIYTFEFTVQPGETFEIDLGEGKLYYSSDEKDLFVDRPVEPAVDFDWHSAYGLYTRALELEKQRRYPDALDMYLESLRKEPAFLPSLDRAALGYYRRMDYDSSRVYAMKALSVDTYDPLANYIYGLASKQKGDLAAAKSGFSIACQSPEYRSAAYTELAMIHLCGNKLSLAGEYALKALSFNAYNTTTLEILAIKYRKENDREKAEKVLAELYATDACNHFINFEKVQWNMIDESTFRQQVRNELAFESYLDLALRYRDYGCTGEAAEVLKLAPEQPVVLLWLAYLDKENRESLLQKALALSPEMVFPHRNETAGMLEYFIRTVNHWKLKYYAALIFWNKGYIDRAKDLFMQCGDEPGYYAFYLAREELFRDNHMVKLRSLEMARELNSSDWRINLAWIDHYLDSRDFDNALKLASASLKKYPGKSVLGLRYARSLIQTEEYKECLSFLEKYEVLPYEGSTQGRNIYHETCIRAAFFELKKNNYQNAITYLDKASLWPENLGVGKPYDTDERLENYLSGYAYEKMGFQEQADAYYLKVMDHETPPYMNESSKLCFQALALRKYRKEEQATLLIDTALAKDPGNGYLKWVKDMFEDGSFTDAGYERLNDDAELQPYDTGFRDREFGLVRDCLEIIR